MGFRYRRSFKVLPGLKLNVTPKNLGVTVGGKRARVSRNTNGRSTRSLNLPVRGLSFQQVRNRRRTLGASQGRPATARRLGVALLCVVLFLLVVGVVMLSMLTR